MKNNQNLIDQLSEVGKSLEKVMEHNTVSFDSFSKIATQVEHLMKFYELGNVYDEMLEHVD